MPNSQTEEWQDVLVDTTDPRLCDIIAQKTGGFLLQDADNQFAYRKQGEYYIARTPELDALKIFLKAPYGTIVQVLDEMVN